MIRYIINRLLFLLPQVILVVAGIFVALRLLPVDPIARIVGQFATEDAQRLAAAQLGLDRPILDQLGGYLSGIARGDLGTSWSTRLPVSQEIAIRFPMTIQLVLSAIVLALAVAIPLGRAVAYRPNTKVDKATKTYSLFAGSQPDFWWALMFVFVFFFILGWFPAPFGILAPGVTPPESITGFILLDSLIRREYVVFVNVLWHLALPILTLSFVITGPLLKQSRNSMRAVTQSDYILYAKASGLSARRIRGYIMRNGMAPVLTLAGMYSGLLLGGAALIEVIFTIDGLGRYAVQRTLAVDFPAIQGAVIVMTAFALLVFLIMDLMYAVLDPRVRYGETSR